MNGNLKWHFSVINEIQCILNVEKKIKPFFHYQNHKTFTFLLIKPMLNFKIKS